MPSGGSCAAVVAAAAAPGPSGVAVGAVVGLAGVGGEVAAAAGAHRAGAASSGRPIRKGGAAAELFCAKKENTHDFREEAQYRREILTVTSQPQSPHEGGVSQPHFRDQGTSQAR